MWCNKFLMWQKQTLHMKYQQSCCRPEHIRRLSSEVSRMSSTGLSAVTNDYTPAYLCFSHCKLPWDKGTGPALAPLTSLGLKRLHSWMSTQNNRPTQCWSPARHYCAAQWDFIKLFTSMNTGACWFACHLVKLLKQQNDLF